MTSPAAESRGTESPGADPARSGLGRVLPYLPIAIGVLVGGVVGFNAGTLYKQDSTVGGLTGVLAAFELVIVAAGCIALLIVGWIFRRFLPRIPIGRTMMAGAAGLAAGTFGGAILGPAYLPQMEVSGRLTIVLDEPAVTLEGDATCRTAPNTRTIFGVAANTVGEAGGHRLHATVNREPSDDSVAVELGQGAEDLPPGSGDAVYVGQLAPLDLHVDGDGGGGSFRFQGLGVSTSPMDGRFADVDWPLSLSGRVEWTCDEVPG